jgi:hypothetical protein
MLWTPVLLLEWTGRYFCELCIMTKQITLLYPWGRIAHQKRMSVSEKYDDVSLVVNPLETEELRKWDGHAVYGDVITSGPFEDHMSYRVCTGEDLQSRHWGFSGNPALEIREIASPSNIQ